MPASILPHVLVVAKRKHDLVVFVLRYVPTSLGALAPARAECQRRGVQLLWARRSERVLTFRNRRIEKEAA